MASKKDNIKALFSNTRTRIIIVFTLILLTVTIAIGFVKFNKANFLGGASDVKQTPPGIQSIPGSLTQTAQYAALQQQQNEQQAAQAAASGGSSIPTIIRSQAFGEGVESVGATGGTGSVGFSTLAREGYGGPQSTLWFQNLKETQCSKPSLKKALNEGAGISDLKLACTCVQLKDVGYSLTDLKAMCSCEELKRAGFNIGQFKQAGFSAGDLKACGFVACQERAAGFSAEEMKNAGYSDGELKGAGFSERDIARAGGLPDGVSIDDVRKAGCEPSKLRQLRERGVTAAAIRRITGCSAAQLKAAGFNAQDLKNAGFSAAELKAAGFSPDQLRQAGYTAQDLLDAGYSPESLLAAGYTPAEIAQAAQGLPPGVSEQDVRMAGCNPDALRRLRASGVSAAAIKKISNCTPEQLKQAGFTAQELLDAGYSPESLLAAGYTPAEIAQAVQGLPPGVSEQDVRNAGCNPDALRRLRDSGVSAAAIKRISNCTPDQLKQAGFTAQELLDAGYSPESLLKAGYTPAEIAQAANNKVGSADGCSVEALKAARAKGVSAATIRRTRGCSANALKNAGFSAAELKGAGFSAAELKNAGFSLSDLKAAGFGPKDLYAAGYTADELKAAGYDAKSLRDAGFSAADLKKAGFSADQLKAAGFSAQDLIGAGFTPDALRKAGFSAKELKAAGLTAAQLKSAGYTGDQLQEAGISSAASALAGLEALSPPSKQASEVAIIPSIAGANVSSKQAAAAQAENAKQFEEILKRQKSQMADQRFQQKLQQRTATMLSAANQMLQSWKTVATQQYQAGSEKEEGKGANGGMSSLEAELAGKGIVPERPGMGAGPLIHMGDIMFAVIDTAVNTDEPGPILATIVSGSLKGAKLIGTFNLPSNADKMVISFNSLSIAGAPKTYSISAFAIDPNTGRTALSSETDHHYLMRYGSLFASTFLEGFGNAFQSADTTITVGGTGGVTDTTVQNGIGRSALENAVIGLATVGKAWGQVAQQNMSRPTTVQVFSGTGIGVLFTQDVHLGEG